MAAEILTFATLGVTILAGVESIGSPDPKSLGSFADEASTCLPEALPAASRSSRARVVQIGTRLLTMRRVADG